MTPIFKIHSSSGRLSAYLPLVLVAAIALAIGLWVQQQQAHAPNDVPDFERIILLPTPRIISDFALTDEAGQVFDKAALQGQWNLLFFGFTHCPDICPTTMLTLKNVRQKLEAQQQWPNLRVIMVSVDPDRDTPERLAPYVQYFHPEFKGVTGAVEGITNFAKELGILFVKNATDADGYYDVDHSVSMILINPQGHYAGVITAPHEAKSLEVDLAKLATYIQAQPMDVSSSDQTEKVTEASASLPRYVANLDQSVFVANAWVRAAPANSPALSAYLELSNTTDQALNIVGASSPLFDNVMIHATVIEDGVASMNHLDELTVAAKSSTSFVPMGQHIMLMGASRTLKLNDAVPITLHTDTGDINFVALVAEQAPE